VNSTAPTEGGKQRPRHRQRWVRLWNTRQFAESSRDADVSCRARGSPSDGRGTPVPLGFQTQMSPRFFKSNLDVPVVHVPVYWLRGIPVLKYEKLEACPFTFLTQ
jgi:hypothetical protein